MKYLTRPLATITKRQSFPVYTSNHLSHILRNNAHQEQKSLPNSGMSLNRIFLDMHKMNPVEHIFQSFIRRGNRMVLNEQRKVNDK